MSSESYGRSVAHLVLRSTSFGTLSLPRSLHHVTILTAGTTCQKGHYQSMLTMKTITFRKPVMDLAHLVEPDSLLAITDGVHRYPD